MYDIIALGELLIDFSPVSSDDEGYPVIAAHPGGAPANYLAAAAEYGMKTAMISKVGNDSFGRLLTASLQARGIGTEGIVADDESFTTLAFVTLDKDGNRSFSFARKPGADTQLKPDEVDYELIGSARVFHFGTLSLTDEPAREATRRAVAFAKEHGKLISFDPNLRKPLWRSLEDARAEMLWGISQADIVKISDEEVEFLWGITPREGAEMLLKEYGVQLVFVTCGPDGCIYAAGNVRGSMSSPPVSPVDTTGAGDIFGGSAMACLLTLGKAPGELTDPDLRDITAFACSAASLSTERHGGISSVVGAEEVKQAAAALL